MHWVYGVTVIGDKKLKRMQNAILCFIYLSENPKKKKVANQM